MAFSAWCVDQRRAVMFRWAEYVTAAGAVVVSLRA